MQKHTAHIPVTLGAIASAVLVLAGIWWVLDSSPSVSPTTDPVGVRDILEYSVDPKATSTDAVVTYAYKGGTLPEKLTAEEVVERRTASSYTKKLAVEGDVQYYETIIYSGEPFVRDADGWYQRELATTTKAAFDSARRQNPIAALFIPRVEAAGTTVFSGAGDGTVEGRAMNNDWNTVVTTGGGNFAGTGSLAVYAHHCPDDDGVEYCNDDFNVIDRGFVPFDTSSIPVSAPISSASLNIYVTSKTNNDNDGLDYVTVVQTNQPSSAALTTADYDNAGGVNATEGVSVGDRKDITSITTGAYLSFTLNSTGIGWIKKSGEVSNCGSTAGFTCLGLREGHDITNTAVGYAQQNYMVASTSEFSGTSQDPYLSVIYSEPNVILKGGRYKGMRIF